MEEDISTPDCKLDKHVGSLSTSQKKNMSETFNNFVWVQIRFKEMMGVHSNKKWFLQLGIRSMVEMIDDLNFLLLSLHPCSLFFNSFRIRGHSSGII